MKIAEEEIRRTSEEAVKEVLIEVGGQLAYEKEKARQLEIYKNELELYNKELQVEIQELQSINKNRFMVGALLGGTVGIVITSIVFALCSTFIK